MVFVAVFAAAYADLIIAYSVDAGDVLVVINHLVPLWVPALAA